AVRRAGPLVDELPVVGVGVGVVVSGGPVERDAHARIPTLGLEDLPEALPGQVRSELGGRLGQNAGADPAGLSDVVVAGVAPLEALVLAAVGPEELLAHELLLGGVAPLGVVLVVGTGGYAPRGDGVGPVLDVVAE